MARGGARPGAGRKAGAITKRTREVADRATEDGVTPLEYMLTVLRNEAADPAQRFEAAKHAAPYMHPKLSSVDVGNKDGQPFEVTRIELFGVEPDGNRSD